MLYQLWVLKKQLNVLYLSSLKFKNSFRREYLIMEEEILVPAHWARVIHVETTLKESSIQIINPNVWWYHCDRCKRGGAEAASSTVLSNFESRFPNCKKIKITDIQCVSECITL